MLGKGKEIGARYAGGQDFVRVFNRALELLTSPAPESAQELLELVKKSKRENDKDSGNPTKKPRTVTGRGAGDVADFQALGHRNNSGNLVAENAQQSGSGSEGGTSNSTTVTSGNMGHAQARLMSVIRSGSGRGRIEKPKRKNTRL